MTNNGFLQGMEMLGEMYEKFSLVVEDEKKVGLWRSLLAPLTDEEFKAAVLYHIHTNRFSPTIADIMDARAKVVSTDYTAEEAWGVVYNDISRFGYYEEPQYKAWKLEATKNAIGWNALCDLTPNTLMATRAHFMRIYDSLKDREKVVAITGGRNAQILLSGLVSALAPNAKQAKELGGGE